MKIICCIPARYESSRFPGKPLASILGRPMIYWVCKAMSQIPEVSRTYVATDDERIFKVVNEFGGNAIMTGECSCGSERVYEACKDLDFDIVLNIQGDEPMMRKEIVMDLISAFNDPDVYIATLKKQLHTENEINNPNIAKVITDKNQNAIYFSRSTIPYNRDKTPDVVYYKHIGVYAYKKDFLAKFVQMPRSLLEVAEELEQLRAIENGYDIRVIETQYESIGVDLPEHISLVEQHMKGLGEPND
ncbi:MAG: 3-deoxy-manno-octulosonate cytidylyltransferase [Defluviitaleaceae bacterium]|nr:3-deoxy-manno-octulosonate cytidylyltransferase [Defluviitaleaceae bacterium]